MEYFHFLLLFYPFGELFPKLSVEAIVRSIADKISPDKTYFFVGISLQKRKKPLLEWLNYSL
jgi:hypothetical protein